MLLAIDPGHTESGYAIVDTTTYEPIEFGKVTNAKLRTLIRDRIYGAVAIEQIGHYGTGMPAGKDVFDTCRWIGRFEQLVEDQDVVPTLVLRAKIKTHLCGNPRAKDGNVIQALVDRFAPGEPNRGKGTKAEPGFFYGFAGDVWQAFALAVYVADGGQE